MNLVDELYAIAAALRTAGVRYAICGGVAVTAHGAPRSTKDIDLVIDPGDVTRALEAVRSLGYVFPALPMTFEHGTDRERAVQRVSKIEGTNHLLLDLLLATGALAGALDDALEVALPQGALRVVSRATLIRMKQLAGRPQDLLDLAALGVGGG
jgi:hypothetical protein